MAANIIFIDPRVWNWQSLVADLPADSIWHLLDEHLDGVAQMQAFLAGYRDLASIQIISHGSAAKRSGDCQSPVFSANSSFGCEFINTCAGLNS